MKYIRCSFKDRDFWLYDHILREEYALPHEQQQALDAAIKAAYPYKDQMHPLQWDNLLQDLKRKAQGHAAQELAKQGKRLEIQPSSSPLASMVQSGAVGEALAYLTKRFGATCRAATGIMVPGTYAHILVLSCLEKGQVAFWKGNICISLEDANDFRKIDSDGDKGFAVNLKKYGMPGYWMVIKWPQTNLPMILKKVKLDGRALLKTIKPCQGPITAQPLEPDSPEEEYKRALKAVEAPTVGLGTNWANLVVNDAFWSKGHPWSFNPIPDFFKQARFEAIEGGLVANRKGADLKEKGSTTANSGSNWVANVEYVRPAPNEMWKMGTKGPDWSGAVEMNLDYVLAELSSPGSMDSGLVKVKPSSPPAFEITSIKNIQHFSDLEGTFFRLEPYSNHCLPGQKVYTINALPSDRPFGHFPVGADMRYLVIPIFFFDIKEGWIRISFNQLVNLYIAQLQGAGQRVLSDNPVRRNQFSRIISEVIGAHCLPQFFLDSNAKTFGGGIAGVSVCVISNTTDARLKVERLQALSKALTNKYNRGICPAGGNKKAKHYAIYALTDPKTKVPLYGIPGTLPHRACRLKSALAASLPVEMNFILSEHDSLVAFLTTRGQKKLDSVGSPFRIETELVDPTIADPQVTVPSFGSGVNDYILGQNESAKVGESHKIIHTSGAKLQTIGIPCRFSVKNLQGQTVQVDGWYPVHELGEEGKQCLGALVKEGFVEEVILPSGRKAYLFSSVFFLSRNPSDCGGPIKSTRILSGFEKYLVDAALRPYGIELPRQVKGTSRAAHLRLSRVSETKEWSPNHGKYHFNDEYVDQIRKLHQIVSEHYHVDPGKIEEFLLRPQDDIVKVLLERGFDFPPVLTQLSYRLLNNINS